MLMILSGIWMVVVKDNSGAIVHRESVGDKNRVVQIVSKYMGYGYEVTVKKSDSSSGDARPLTFVEGNTNVVTSINAGSGINVDNTDPANPIISLPSCADNQLLMKSGGSWVCVDKGSIAGSSGDYTRLTMLSQKYGPAKYDDALVYCADLDSLGYNDWRLPNYSEFFYLCKRFNKCLDGDLYWVYDELGVVDGSNALQIIVGRNGYGELWPYIRDGGQSYYFYCVR